MKSAIVIFAVLACAYSKPQIFYGGFPFGGAIQYSSPITYQTIPTVQYTAVAPTIVANPTIVADKFQFHSQTELGQAHWGYGHPGQSHTEVRDALGGVKGSYAYIGADGKHVQVNYVADAVNGFRVASNALPVAPGIPEAPVLVGPSPVQDTEEVAQAKAEHQKAIEEAKARNAEADKKDAEEVKAEEPQAEENKEAAPSRRKRSLIAYSSPTLGYSYGAVTYASHPVLASPALTYAAPTIVHRYY